MVHSCNLIIILERRFDSRRSTPRSCEFSAKGRKPSFSGKFKSRSIAEQNSFCVAWALLSEDRFKDLRNTIYRNEAEATRFRHLVIQAVMATDLFDKDNSKFREDRWNKSFDTTGSAIGEESPIQALDRKDTLVLEHLTMAVDISHTMQHWHLVVLRLITNIFSDANAHLSYIAFAFTISGKFTGSGTPCFLKRCMLHTNLVKQKRTLRQLGMDGKFGFLIIM